MAADQVEVPTAFPELPVEVDHLMAVTPILSEAEPLKEMLEEVVETMVDAGDRMAREGGRVSPVVVLVPVPVPVPVPELPVPVEPLLEDPDPVDGVVPPGLP